MIAGVSQGVVAHSTFCHRKFTDTACCDGDFKQIGAVISAGNTIAAGLTLGLLEAGADEVSAAVALVFSRQFQQYQTFGRPGRSMHRRRGGY
jgi:hypothetical protein